MSYAKNTQTNGKNSKYTNTIDISITGGNVGSAVGRGGGVVGGSFGGAVSSIACIASIAAAFFLHHLKYFLSPYSYSSTNLCELPQHPLRLL